MAREHLSLRVDASLKRALEHEAVRRGTPKTALAESLLREAVQTASHPAVIFRDGPAGRRARLIGGPDVWELIEVWRDEGCDGRAVAGTLGVDAGLVDAALAYYADNRPEIEEWIERNRLLADQAERAARMLQALADG